MEGRPASHEHAAGDQVIEAVTLGRTRGAAAPNGVQPQGRRQYVDDIGSSEESEDATNVTSSGNEWDGGDDEADEENEEDDEEEDLDMSDDRASEEDDVAKSKHSLVVQLRYAKGTSRSPPTGLQLEATGSVVDASSGRLNKDLNAIKFDDSEMTDAQPNGLLPAPGQADHVSNLPLPQPRFSASDPASLGASQGNLAETSFGAEKQQLTFNPDAYIYSGGPPPSNLQQTPSNFSGTQQIPSIITSSKGMPPTVYH